MMLLLDADVVALAPGVMMTVWPESPGRDKQVE